MNERMSTSNANLQLLHKYRFLQALLCNNQTGGRSLDMHDDYAYVTVYELVCPTESRDGDKQSSLNGISFGHPAAFMVARSDLRRPQGRNKRFLQSMFMPGS